MGSTFKKCLLLCAWLLALPAAALDVGDVFLMLPDDAVMDISTQQRRQMLSQNVQARQPGAFAIETLDKRHGYLRLRGAFEGAWEMCYWNLETGAAKLVAVASSSCGPACSGNLRFYQLGRDGKLREVSESLTKDFPLVIDFLPASRLGAQQREIFSASREGLSYRLPRKGKDIEVHIDELTLENLFADSSPTAQSPPRLQQRRILMRWNGSGFER